MTSETFKIAFFNVGQGNCTVVKYLTTSTNIFRAHDQHVWIIDAGSSQLPICGITFPSKRALASYISEWIGRGPQSINIVLTHQDDDHKNLIDFIVDTYRTSFSIKFNYFVGYTKDKKGKIVHYDLQTLGITPPSGAEEWGIEGGIGFNLNGECPDDKTERAKPTYNPYRLPVVFLNRKSPFKIYSDTNRNSLVVKFTYEPNSILLTGDATRDTFKRDLDEHPDNLKATILELSHHGADTHRTNSPSLLNDVKPTYCILSAHLNSQYGHPAPRVVGVLQDYYRDNFRDRLNNDGRYHFFFSNIALDSLNIGKNPSNQGLGQYDARFAPVALMLTKELKPDDITDDDWRQSPSQEVRTLYVTNYPLFYTACDGTIIFTLTKGKPDLEITSYDYESTSLGKGEKALKGWVNKYFKKAEIMTRLHEFLEGNARNYSPLAINIIENSDGNFLTFMKDNKASFPDIRVLNIRESGMELNEDRIKNIIKPLLDFPQLARIYAYEDQFKSKPNDDLNNMLIKRFFSVA